MKFLLSDCIQCEESILEFRKEVGQLYTIVDEEEWIAIRLEEQHCFLIGIYEDKDKAIHFAALDYGMKHRKEPLSYSLVTGFSYHISKSDLFQCFYGIESLCSIESELYKHGILQDEHSVWKVGLPKDIIGNH